ncbi:hypothetical protein D9M69_392900 [compost metagenome]
MKVPGKPVTRGIRAFLKTCFQSTRRSERPLARAVSTYWRCISSRKVFFVSRVFRAKVLTTDAVTGKVMCQR